ncbi:MAG: 1-acyl-sn-glycerol-3-phosphate acyltransferase [Bacteroidales bacterium]|jgi:1-acyl-sn-glycerol-3-phosphate acyltransferase|nr:1-acyl-sn-glycerol-3-phosphate acyltransferase [Bacteroidales bacterium]
MNIYKLILKICGWSVVGIKPEENKFVCIVAPHTSFWDFVWGWLSYRCIGIPSNFLIKKEFFTFPIKRLLLGLGGVPVNRQQARNMVQYCVNLFNTKDRLALTITPEGTRKYTTKWKKGFYHIARQANVPLYIGFIDYQKKQTGLLTKFEITGDFDADFSHIQDLLRGYVAKYPKNYSLS